MKDEFFEWFRAQDPERLLSKELAAKDAWDYQAAKLQVAVEALENIAHDSPYARGVLELIKAK